MLQALDIVELKIPAKPEYIGVVRLTISGIANRLGYSYDDIEDMKIAVAEACTNVVTHAYADDHINRDMLVTCGVYEDHIRISVADKGGHTDVENFRKGNGPVSSSDTIEQLKEGGLGLYLIETLMDDVEVSSNSGVVIVMTKFLRRSEVEQSDHSISKEASQ